MNADMVSVQSVLKTSEGDAIDVVLEIASETSGVIAQETFRRKRTGVDAMSKAEKVECAQQHVKKTLAARTADRVWQGMAPGQKNEALLMYLADQTMNNP